MDKEGFEMGVASVKDSDIEQAAAMNDIRRRSHIQDIAGITKLTKAVYNCLWPLQQKYLLNI
jgi:hypothetical protein